MVDRVLFAYNRTRTDIQLAIAFMSTRMKDRDKNYYSEIIRLMQYLKGTQDFWIILRAYNTNIIKWYIDASHEAHN